MQAQNESISQYVHALRGLAKECSFQVVSAQKYKNDMTRDAFINGLRSDTTRRRLLEEETLDLDTAIKKAKILEVAKQQTELYAKSLDKLNSDSTDRNRDSTDRLATTFVPNDKVSNSEENVSLTATTLHFKCSKKKCFFCGGALHAGGRSNCPAKNRECYGCGKLGHYQKVCQSKNKRTISAVGTVNDDCKNSLAVLASAPCCLKPTVVTGFLKNVKLDCLLDSGASENFINKKVVDELRLKIFGAKTNVAMASQAFSVKVLGKVKETLKLKGRTYDNLTLGVVPKLCADIVLGQAFMIQHEEVVFKLGGSKKGLVVAHCGVAASRVHSQRLFRNLIPGCQSIVTKSRKFNNDDRQFIYNEVSKLLNDNIIEPSYSPWRAQVLLTKD